MVSWENPWRTCGELASNIRNRVLGVHTLFLATKTLNKYIQPFPSTKLFQVPTCSFGTVPIQKGRVLPKDSKHILLYYGLNSRCALFTLSHTHTHTLLLKKNEYQNISKRSIPYCPQCFQHLFHPAAVCGVITRDCSERRTSSNSMSSRCWVKKKDRLEFVGFKVAVERRKHKVSNPSCPIRSWPLFEPYHSKSFLVGSTAAISSNKERGSKTTISSSYIKSETIPAVSKKWRIL